ncbi:preprotein translocase subunit YajC [Yimella sp. cx-573]|nr:preprotein translocase subunit YajC [Yimella sp. cx-573]
MHALATQASGQSSSGVILLLLPLALLAVMFWFSRRRQKQFAQAQKEIEVGEEVSTTSGLFGRLVAMDDQTATLEIAQGVQVQFDRRAIVPRRIIEPLPTSGDTDEKA